MIAAPTTLDAWLLWLVGSVAALLALYLLRPRRRRIEVPFGGLWERVLTQGQARVRGTRWRRWLSWLLMVCLSALLLAVSGERWVLGWADLQPDPPQPSHTVVLLDVSASMATRDGEAVTPTGGLAPDPRRPAGRWRRMDEARARLRQLVYDARRGERFLFLAASGRVETLTGWTSRLETLDTALQHLTPTDAALDLRRALQAARDALDGRAEPRVVLLTDGGPAFDGAEPPASALASPPVQIVSVGPLGRAQDSDEGTGVDNLAVERVAVRPSAEDPARGRVTVRVRNDRGEPARAVVTLAGRRDGRTPADFLQDGAALATREVTLPATMAQTVAFDDVALDAQRLAAHVRTAASEPWADLAAHDDVGLAVLASRRKLRVLLVTAGNLFLEAGLLANARVEVVRKQPAEYQPQAWAADVRSKHRVDVVVLDQVDAPLPAGMPGLRLDLRSGGDGPAGEETARFPELRVRAANHPTLRGVGFANAHLDVVRLLQPEPGDVALVSVGAGPVMVARDAGVRRLFWGIDLLETDLGGRYLLPVLLANAVDWLVGEDDPLVAPLPLGRDWSIEVPVRGQRWSWLEPAAAAPRRARVSGVQILGASERHGVHVWRSEPTGVEVARPTVVPPSEAPGLVVERQIDAWRATPTDELARLQPAPPALWRWALFIAIALLVLEWWLYMRRRTV